MDDPEPNNRVKWLLTISSGLFLFFVLYVYEGFGIPRGISSTGHGLLFRAMSFGLITSLSFFVNEFYARPRLAVRSFRRRLAWYSWELFCAWNLVYLLYNYFWGWEVFSWFGYADILGEISSVLILPFALAEVYYRYSIHQPDNPKKLLFRSENEKESLLLAPDDLLFIRSEDNYVNICFSKNGEVRNHLIRSSLKQIENNFEESNAILRCHRSYILNPERVISFSESSRGARVMLPYSIEVPVSRSYADKVRSAIGSHPSRI